MMKKSIKIMRSVIGIASNVVVSAYAQQPQPAVQQEQTAPQPKPNAGQPQGNGQYGKMTSDQRVQMRLAKMKESLNLTNDQAIKVQALLQEQEKQHEANMANHNAEAAKVNREKMKDELSKILTPEQMTKFKEMRKNQMQHKQGNPSNGGNQGDEQKD